MLFACVDADIASRERGRALGSLLASAGARQRPAGLPVPDLVEPLQRLVVARFLVDRRRLPRAAPPRPPRRRSPHPAEARHASLTVGVCPAAPCRVCADAYVGRARLVRRHAHFGRLALGQPAGVDVGHLAVVGERPRSQSYERSFRFSPAATRGRAAVRQAEGPAPAADALAACTLVRVRPLVDRA